MLIHLTTDRLCPHDKTLNSLNCKYCIVDRSTLDLRFLAHVNILTAIGLISVCHMVDILYTSSSVNTKMLPFPKLETLLH